MTKKRVLIIYYSYSSQTRKLIQAFAAGLQEKEIEVKQLLLKPAEKLQFPLGSVYLTLKMMVETFFRKRIEIEPLELDLPLDCDLIVLAGPTWSYNPSGPILRFLDIHGDKLSQKKVLPFISCRGYWRIHSWQLRLLLRQRRAEVLRPLVFLHTGAEPWRTIGVFLKLAGKVPESGKTWISRYYSKYGHTRDQVDYAERLGRITGESLEGGIIDKMRLPCVVKDVGGSK